MNTYANRSDVSSNYPPAKSYAESAQKIISSVVLAALITFSLVMLMNILISEKFKVVPPKETRLMPPIIMPKPKPPEVRIKEIVKPVPPEVTPPQPQTIDFEPQQLAKMGLMLGPVSKTLEGPNLIAAQEGEPIPYLRVAPVYPARPLGRGIEGHVDLRFDITATGATAAVQVVNAVPEGTFNRAAVRAVSKWKYKPQLKNGVAVEKKGVTTRVSFRITD